MNHFTKCCKILYGGILEDSFRSGRLSRVGKIRNILQGFESYFKEEYQEAIKFYIRLKCTNALDEELQKRRGFMDVAPLFRSIESLVNAKSQIEANRAIAGMRRFIPKNRFDRHDYKQFRDFFLW